MRSQPLKIEMVAPPTNNTTATMNDQKYIDFPRPNGCVTSAL